MPKLITVPGRVLNAPQVKYFGNETVSTRNGSWNMTQVKFTTKTELRNWTYLYIHVQWQQAWKDQEAFNITLNTFAQALKKVGVNAGVPRPGMNIHVNPANAEAEIDKAFLRFNNPQNGIPPKLVLVIIPEINSVIYNRVKYAGDVK